jgi:hypothetical protein
VKTLDGFLSRQAQKVHRDAIVWHQPGCPSVFCTYVMERTEGESLGLGKTFHEARQAIAAIVAAEKARQADAR